MASTTRLLNPVPDDSSAKTSPPDQLLLVGFAGAVDPSLKTGDLVLSPRYFRADEGTSSTGGIQEYLIPDHALWERAQRTAAQTGGKVVKVDSLTVPNLVATPKTKNTIGQRYPVGIVNMEDYWVAAAAQKAGVPFLSARVVLDRAGQSLPPYLLQIAGPRFSGVLGVVTRPWRIPPLLHLSRQAAAARKVLTQFARTFVQQTCRENAIRENAIRGCMQSPLSPREKGFLTHPPHPLEEASRASEAPFHDSGGKNGPMQVPLKAPL
jgi:hypothetical protein